jgi:SAM-dependent methyltransferase
MEPYFRGERLWGDDFTEDEIAAWFADEAEASFDLGVAPHAGEYPWAEQQRRHCFAHLPARRWEHVLGFGSATGVELLPLHAERATIVEPTARWSPDLGLRFPVEYVRAQTSGRIDLPDDSVDLIVAFGVLHHVPNVSRVLAEFARLCRPGGFFAMAEPIISMGDWRRPRAGLTPRERGLPVPWLRAALPRAGFRIERLRLVAFSGNRVLQRFSRRSIYNRRGFVALDAAICSALRWRTRYHAESAWQKVRPTTVAIVAVAAEICTAPSSGST